MKILYVDRAVVGHHIKYLTCLAHGTDADAVAVIPSEVSDLRCKQYVYTTPIKNVANPKVYLQWIRELKGIVKREKPDIIHFLYGDTFYRFFGLKLSGFKKTKTVLTLHWVRNGFIRQLSAKKICKKVDTVVVHSGFMKKQLNDLGVKNVTHVEYPCFDQNVRIDKAEACAYWGIRTDVPTIVCIGNTRYDKGLDILLGALQCAEHPFQLLVCGKEEAFGQSFIEEKIQAYADRVKLCLHYLSEEELSHALGAADIIALPYRRSFNGASGPLGEGVALGKTIVGADHGSLGDLIRENHLGYTFESENEESLAAALNAALSSTFEKDEVYKSYQDSLNVDSFLKKYKAVYRALIQN